MIKILWIIPHHNEELSTVMNNLNLFIKYSRNKNFNSKFIIADGGSQYKILSKLQENVASLKNTGVNITMTIPIPIFHPNKNLSIWSISQHNFGYDIACVIDSDWKNITHESLDSLILPIINSNYDICLPDNKKSGARINRLVGNPLFFILNPALDHNVPFPFSGMIAIKYNLLQDIVKYDYAWDWGGEAQIILKSFFKKASFNSFEFPKIESKKRSLSSKLRDAYQIFMAIIYENMVHNNITSTVINNSLKRLERTSEIDMFLSILSEILPDYNYNMNFEIDKIIKPLTESINSNHEFCSQLLQNIYQKTGRYEFVVLKYFTALFENIIFNDVFTKVINPKEIELNKIEKLDLQSLVDLATLIYGVLLLVGVKSYNFSERFSNFKNYISNLSPLYTELSRYNELKFIQNENDIDLLEILTANDNLKGVISKHFNEYTDVVETNDLFLNEFKKHE